MAYTDENERNDNSGREWTPPTVPVEGPTAEQVREWKRKAEGRFMTSSLDEYCPDEFVILADAYLALIAAATPSSDAVSGVIIEMIERFERVDAPLEDRVLIERASRVYADLIATHSDPDKNKRIAELTEALKPFAYYFDLNDLAERHDQGVIEVPIGDLRRAAQALSTNASDPEGEK